VGRRTFRLRATERCILPDIPRFPALIESVPEHTPVSERVILGRHQGAIPAADAIQLFLQAEAVWSFGHCRDILLPWVARPSPASQDNQEAWPHCNLSSPGEITSLFAAPCPSCNKSRCSCSRTGKPGMASMRYWVGHLPLQATAGSSR
jgi:hypothetical protein